MQKREQMMRAAGQWSGFTAPGDNHGTVMEGKHTLYLALRWQAAAPDDPLPRYLVGLQLLRAEEHASAVEALAGPPGTLADPLLDEQRRAMLVVSLVRLGRFDEAERVLGPLARSPRSSKSVWAEEYLARIAFLRGWKGFRPWTPRGPPR